jgi:hypothetical protein
VKLIDRLEKAHYVLHRVGDAYEVLRARVRCLARWEALGVRARAHEPDALRFLVEGGRNGR